MNLFLVQHGKYKTKDQDPEESLSDEGIYAITCLANFLTMTSIYPEYIIHSPKTRSKKTAKILQRTATLIESDKMKANTPAKETLSIIPQNAKNVLLTGHLPNLEEIANHLCGGKIAFEMGGIGYIQDNTLKWYLTPKLIRMMV